MSYTFLRACLLPGMMVNVALAATVANAVVDYVIVGVGPAGLVLAEQLTLNTNVSVVLLEAGVAGDTNPLVESK